MRISKHVKYHLIKVVEQGNYHVIAVTECLIVAYVMLKMIRYHLSSKSKLTIKNVFCK